MAQYYYDVDAMKKYIVANASKYGLDPATALRVWQGEGLSKGTWQSRLYQNGKREESYGPFQFNMNPDAMGDRFYKQTGLDPRDPKNVYAMADYAMAHAGKHGWGEWFAARDNNIGPWEGITRGVSQGVANFKPGAAAGDDPSISPQNYGFSAPHLPSLGNMPMAQVLVNKLSEATGVPQSTMSPSDPYAGVRVESAAGPPMEPEKTGILAKIFGSTGKRPDPYWMKGKGWDEEAKKAYFAQNLQDGGWPNLRSYLG